MKKAKVISALLYLFIKAPISFYLFYKILEAIQASELMWFLFWVSVPVTLIASLILNIADND